MSEANSKYYPAVGASMGLYLKLLRSGIKKKVFDDIASVIDTLARGEMLDEKYRDHVGGHPMSVKQCSPSNVYRPHFL